ncbi:hypothetical protein AB0B66_23420 [Catellatospora sp. NPDC049111]|uniref:hypothetical protein n=1 Tax=Catellatospora sp. NPDC049111 TaxID=3155271 RepID=UPI0033EF7D7D
MRTSYIEPITDKRAAFLYEELYRHRNRKRMGRCRICAKVSCQAVWQGTAELLMAGREPVQPGRRRWRMFG